MLNRRPSKTGRAGAFDLKGHEGLCMATTRHMPEEAGASVAAAENPTNSICKDRVQNLGGHCHCCLSAHGIGDLDGIAKSP